MLAGAVGANAYWMPRPVITSETKEDGKVKITWDYDTEGKDATPYTHFVVTVYKMHKATANERFVLAKTDFDYIESTGTFVKPQDRLALWDQLPECPGWRARFPMYLDKALGFQVFMNFTGSTVDEIFNGAYIVSPDYDLTYVTDKKFNVRANLAKEHALDIGAIVVWAWNTNVFDAKNADYKPILEGEKFYDDLSYTNWKEKSEEIRFPNPDDYTDPEDIEEINCIDYTRTRVQFYGRGYNSVYVNDFEVSVDLKAGDMIDYGASEVRVDGSERSYTIDTTGDTDNDYVYAYEVYVINEENNEYGFDAIRATSHPYKNKKHVIGNFAGVECIGDAADTEVSVIASNGYISVAGAQDMEVYNTSGACVYSGSADRQVNVGKGVFIVKAGSKTKKVIM